MERVFGRSVIPPQVAQFQYREDKLKKQFGIKDDFDKFQESKSLFEDKRPPVSINKALVFVEKRPSNSNRFLPPFERFVVQRPEIQARATSQFSQQGIILEKYPLTTRFEHFNLRSEDGINRQRQFMQ